MDQTYEFEGQVELFPQDNGWYFVRAPSKLSKPLEIMAERGLIAVLATVGPSSWPTSLLPYGDGTHFIALPAKVRKKEKLTLGNNIKVSFVPRVR